MRHFENPGIVWTVSSIFRDIQQYSAMRDIKVYWDILRHNWSILSHIQIYNPSTFTIWGIFKSLSNMEDDQAYSEPWHSKSRLFKHFQGYLGIFGDIDAYSATFTGAQLGGRGNSPLHFYENWKKCPGFGKKDLDSLHFWIKFPIQNVVLRVFRRKNPKMFSCRAFFPSVFNEMFIKVPQFHMTSPALKDFWLRTWIQALFFLQNAPS